MKKITIYQKQKILELSVALILILIGAGLRLLPHPPNFTPILAIALFGGVYLSRKTAFILPLAAMVISDIFIGYYQFSLMIFVYISFLLCVALGFWLKKHKKWQAVLGGSILSALIFFFLTNFAVWIFTPWYAKTISGLTQCYLMALPFFKNTLLGSFFYSTVLFGAYELAKILVRKKITSIISPGQKLLDLT
ncbi:hypothetical protein KAS79_01810 [Candidatus Parcubacteria bacterium]|nr:hypothetical protein [Candidatus Parcubacteria bacterium]